MKCYEIELVDDKGDRHEVGLMTDNPDNEHIAEVACNNLFQGKHIHAMPLKETIREVDGI